MTQEEYRSEITLNERGKEVIRVDEEGFHYNSQFIADAGEAHRLMVAFLKQNTAQPEQEGPTDEELNDVYWEAAATHPIRKNSAVHTAALRAVLARWGK